MTDEELLSIALHPGQGRWDELHEVCSARKRAEALARLLERHAHAGQETAVSWARALEEMHPGLKVNLVARPAAPTVP